MPSFCAVQNCSDKYGHADNISFHKFPFKREELLQKWLNFAERGTNWRPSKWSAICSRHFRDEDFKCSADRKILKKAAVPSLRVLKHIHGPDSDNLQAAPTEDASKDKQLLVQSKEKNTDGDDIPVAEAVEDNVDDCDEEEQNGLQNTPLTSSPSTPKVKCRLCGSTCSSVVSFSTNFEIYGMIQKCFPTLNIQKDDHLPKEMCRTCLKRLETFSRFVDKVLETQSELQRKYRIEKASNSSRAIERQLKVKQEPVVRVKQEVAEGFESFLSDDLDMGMDEGCEQENEADTSVEQKYDFCDFPMLNAQDIINNCDIMEIINLDDPFINIPDDDANTNCENGQEGQQQQQEPEQSKHHQGQQRNKSVLPSAHDLLQTHLLSEEHNYAYTTEDLKEEWQLRNIYKTEKTDGTEYGETAEFIANVEPEDDEQGVYAGEEQQHGDNDNTAIMYKNFSSINDVPSNNANTENVAASSHSPAAETRSTRPIVTSVSDFADASLNLSNGTGSGHIHNEKLVVTAVNDILGPNADTTAAPSGATASTSPTVAIKPHAKPNIVVLNESIVKSSSVFQLHTCPCCQLKFFSVESLNQHYNVAHQSQTPLEEGSQLRAEQQKQQGDHAQQQQQLQVRQLQHPYNQQQQQNMLTHNNHFQQHQHQQHQQQQQQQHAQAQLPMVSVPTDYLWKPYGGTSGDLRNEPYNFNCKVEKDFSLTTAQAGRTHKAEDNLSYQQPNIFEQQFGLANSHNTKNTFITPNSIPKDVSNVGAPNVVRILEMKRTFLRQHEPYHSIGNVPPTQSTDSVKTGSFYAATLPRTDNHSKPVAPTLTPPPPPKRRKHRLKINSKVIARLNALERKVTAAVTPDFFATEYRQLRRRYLLLQRKCKSLEVHVLGKQAAHEDNTVASSISATKTPTKQQAPVRQSQSRFRCLVCHEHYKSIYHLLRHKRTRRHWPQRATKYFAATCCGCEKFFRHKIALRNHMRYICQALPLCWFKSQMQTFKCRCCRRSTFNHWRLYRRHEVKCKSARKRKKQASDTRLHGRSNRARGKSKQRAMKAFPLSDARKTLGDAPTPAASKQKHSTASAREYMCPVCAKAFASANSLNQHSITHTDQRRHMCRLCDRAFKRRNGLTQHVRGYHLKLKPHKCTVCQRSYALKSDMLRCRHAAVKRAVGTGNNTLPVKNEDASSAK
ncbi:PREDICTED: uncharacterized protein LOC108370865 isoform X2 [Rhagoletis zephyria]|uniref:uncharacterized protein LOC108370865 isoform X2 n=1 Tax=Rhagoletis zephyria TaxID=28612 RepID=UPI0008117C7E|nr:PREDICTED: uncharacterized protein LOC108370865 isoform X2 [Rhagoletis zephyria]